MNVIAATMDNYDGLEFPAYLQNPFPGHGLQSLDFMSVTSGMDMHDQYSNFGGSEYMSGDDMTFTQANGLPHQAMFQRYNGEQEEALAPLTPSGFEQLPAAQASESPSVDPDNRYLCFRYPTYKCTLLDEGMRQVSLNMQAQLNGMFFLAESQWPATPDNPSPPPELTCYRRNLFQITGSVTLPRGLRYIWHNDARIPIVGLDLAVSATESVEGNVVKLISVPFKTPTGTETAKPEDKAEKEPPTIPLDSLGGQDMDAEFATHPIQWKRLQFRIATANNGRRKELQQHFTLKLTVVATLSTSAKYPIAETDSQPMIVRGRSPRNFASRKDVPLSSGGASRKHIPSLARNSSSQTSVPHITSNPAQLTRSPNGSVPISYPYEENSSRHGSNVAQWQQNVPIPDYIASPNFNNSTIPQLPQTYTNDLTPEIGQTMSFGMPNMSGPGSVSAETLYLGSDDGGSPLPHVARRNSRPPTSNPSPSMNNRPRERSLRHLQSPSPPADSNNKKPRLQSYQGSSTSVPNMNPAPTSHPSPLIPGQPNPYTNMPFTPDDSESEGKYKYLPVPEDEWLPPVEATFRPHGSHHYGSFSRDRLPLDSSLMIGNVTMSTGNKRSFSQL